MSGNDLNIELYAELLSNIRQLSVVATLTSPSDSTTQASLSHDGAVLQIKHQGQSREIALPEKPSSAALHLPKEPAAVLSWRLPLPPADLRSLRFTLEDQPIPWSAHDLKAGAAIECRDCGARLVNQGAIEVWKDLPSDNWAEMMEFWHCHKPHDHNHGQIENASATTKGYGANNVTSAQSGAGLVDLNSILLSPSDCQNISFSSILDPSSEVDLNSLSVNEPDDTRFLYVHCRKCGKDVGMYSLITQSTSLFKWRINLTASNPEATEVSKPSITQCLAATLISNISRSGSAKTMIAPHQHGTTQLQPSDKHRSLYVWVLNPNVVYSSSSSPQATKVPASKILFRSIDVQAGNDIVDAMTSDVQELSMPSSSIEEILQALEASQKMLPERERLFKEWNVGLLHRWELAVQ